MCKAECCKMSDCVDVELTKHILWDCAGQGSSVMVTV